MRVGAALSACLSQMKGAYFSIKQKVGFLLGASYPLVYNGLPGGASLSVCEEET